MNLKELSAKEEKISPGHRACAGCSATTIARQALLASDSPLVVVTATGCLEVVTTIFPQTAWKVPYIHNAFENAAATIAGIEAAYKALKERGELPCKEEPKFIGLGGDGGTYDIGLQALSGAIERKHDFLFICYNNEAYMNTGIQRSGATPKGASTTTSPAGEQIPGKRRYRKDLTKIVIAHEPVYAAQASPSKPIDLMGKVKKGLELEGPSFINVIAPCPRGWRFSTDKTLYLADLAIETCHWPLYEWDGSWKLTSISSNIADGTKEKKPMKEWLQKQGRFKHLFKPENKKLLKQIQRNVDKKWEELKASCKPS